MGVRGQRHAPAAPYPRERPGTHCTGGCVGLRAGLDWCGKSRPTGIRSPDRPARRQSLYRLRYPAHFLSLLQNINVHLCGFLNYFYVLRKYKIKILYRHFLFTCFLSIKYSVHCTSQSPILRHEVPVLRLDVTENMKFKRTEMFRTTSH